MQRLRSMFCFLLVFLLCFCLLIPVRATTQSESRAIIQQMLNYYCHYQEKSQTDVYRLLEELQTTDPEEAALWRSIFDHWFFAITELPRNNVTLPDDLPQNDSLCIVVLGYRLQSSGAMEAELIGRLELALSAARQYPNALILCTGGGTASEAPGVTEAHQMVSWLKKQGIDSNRIIIESGSYHTIQNAQFGLQILARDYPQVRSIVLVTSDYHLPRSSTLFHAQMQLHALQNESPALTFAGFLGFEAGHEGFSEDPLDQTAHVARLCGFEYIQADAPVLSCPEALLVDGPALLEAGEDLLLTVTACYDSGYRKEVTEKCQISGYDPLGTDSQSVLITYSENDMLLTATLEISRPVPETEPPAETTPPAPEREIAYSGTQLSMLPMLFCPLFLGQLLLILCLLIKKR